MCPSRLDCRWPLVPQPRKTRCWSAACWSAWQSLEKVHRNPFSDLMTYTHAPLAPASSIWCLADHSLLTFHLRNERLAIRLASSGCFYPHHHKLGMRAVWFFIIMIQYVATGFILDFRSMIWHRKWVNTRTRAFFVWLIVKHRRWGLNGVTLIVAFELLVKCFLDLKIRLPF